MNARLLPSTYMRPLANSPWMRRHEPRFCRSFVLVVFFWQLLQAISKDIPGTRREIFRNLVNTNSTTNNTRGKTSVNETTLTDQNEEDFHLAYSGYLRSSSSMLLLQTSDITHNDFLSTNNNTSFDKSLNSSEHKRSKRGVTHLYNMIVCATGCDPLSYKGYGCYCGFLGSGYPMDGIDRCCKMHDWCYDATNCPMFVEYFVPYYWKCYHGYKPICAIEHGEWGNSGSCAQRLCECDRSFAECLRRYRCPRHKAVCTSSPWRLIQNIFMIV